MAEANCKNLRTKKGAPPALDDRRFLEEQDPYLQYFCIRTLHAVGPDDNLVCPQACNFERRCFQPRFTPAAL